MKKVLIGSAIGIMGLVLSVSSVFAATTVSGNGVGSHNTVVTVGVNVSKTNQTNIANFGNGIVTTTNTGGNKTNKNTGGSVTQTGGSTTNTVGVSNLANTNTATGNASCCCDAVTPVDVSITGNGVWSSNKVITKTKCINVVNQTNVATISNSVVTTTNTGGNTANSNTGGDVSVTSGDATTDVTVTNVANSNSSL